MYHSETKEEVENELGNNTQSSWEIVDFYQPRLFPLISLKKVDDIKNDKNHVVLIKIVLRKTRWSLNERLCKQEWWNSFDYNNYY